MALSGHLARIRANAIQPRQTELRNHRPGHVNPDENAFWVVVCARSRFLNDVPSVLERQQYASAPWKFLSQESCFSSVALVLSRPVQSTRDEPDACVPLALINLHIDDVGYIFELSFGITFFKLLALV